MNKDKEVDLWKTEIPVLLVMVWLEFSAKTYSSLIIMCSHAGYLGLILEFVLPLQKNGLFVLIKAVKKYIWKTRLKNAFLYKFEFII